MAYDPNEWIDENNPDEFCHYLGFDEVEEWLQEDEADYEGFND